jgi:hypothetical protein
MRIVLSMLFLLAHACMLGQTISGKIMDAQTGEALPFVSIIEQSTLNGTYSDIDGIYSLSLSDSSNAIMYGLVGYESFTIGNYRLAGNVISLTPKNNLLSEIRIRPGINPAERIIQNAIANKKRNKPESDMAFTYDSYNKLVFGGDIDSTLLRDTTQFKRLSKETKEAYNFLNAQYIFLMESITHRKFCPPYHSEETIIANRVSGLKMTELFLLGTQLQSFSFYGESVELLDVKYMSPLADNAINKYLFQLEDTTFIGIDTVYTISFQPRSKKNFPSMMGRVYINTNGYAIQNVLAEPAKVGGFNIKIQQQYAWLENKKWFPMQLNSNLTFDSTMWVAGVPLVGQGRSYIKNITLNADLTPADFTPITLQILPEAGRQPDSLWNQYRERELDAKEVETYHVVDSLGKELNLDRRVKAFEALTTGQLNMGYINLDLRYLLSYNQYEHFRLGAGLRTSHRVSEKFSIGGYATYGFGDKAWKFGGDALIHLYRLRNCWLKFEYQNDLMEMGGNHILPDREGFFTPHLYPIFISRMDRREKEEISVNGRLLSNLTTTLFANHQYVSTFDNYTFIRRPFEEVSLNAENFDLIETGIRLRYAPGERLVRTSSREIRLGGRFPVVYVNMTKGWNSVAHGDISYKRMDARVDKTFNIQNIGKLSFVAQAGHCSDDIPLSLLYNAQGTYDKITIAIPNTFQTMRTNEFMHSSYALLHIRHSFLDLLYQHGNFKPHLVLAHSMMWGDFKFPSSHNFTFHSANKGYFESGIQVDNLISSGISGIGVGAYYRYGPYALPSPKDNWAFKITSSLSF